MDKPLFETDLSFFDYFLGIILTLASLAAAVYFAVRIPQDGWGNLMLVAFALIFAIQTVRTNKIFLLYPDKLIVRLPLTFTTGTDAFFETDDIKEVVFRRVRGRFGGPHILIYCKKRWHESYRTDFSKATRSAFINTLRGLNIKVTDES